MRRAIQSMIVLLAALAIGGRPAYAAGDGALLGLLGGAALGGFVGSQIGHGHGRGAATGLGIFTGAVVGTVVGDSLERSSRYESSGGYRYSSGYRYRPTYYETYEPTYVAPYAPPPSIIYTQPRIVEYQTDVPTIEEGGYVGASSVPPRYCREYTQKINIDGQIQESYGTACLSPDGTWRIER